MSTISHTRDVVNLLTAIAAVLGTRQDAPVSKPNYDAHPLSGHPSGEGQHIRQSSALDNESSEKKVPPRKKKRTATKRNAVKQEASSHSEDTETLFAVLDDYAMGEGGSLISTGGQSNPPVKNEYRKIPSHPYYYATSSSTKH